jgi:mono/diheme cytochrome c family protein
MMDRHHAAVPAEFASLQSPVPADPESLARGQELYSANCASCHGDSGMGEGPAGQQLDPPAAPVAHTSQMLSDGYLFWRIAEGGHAIGTAMPTWKDALDEQARWDLINYLRALGQGDLPPGPGMGRGRLGRGPGPLASEAEHRAAMLADAVAIGALTQEEADFFEQVHQVLDEHYAANSGAMEQMAPRGMMAMQRALTGQAVRDGYITAAEADRFTEIHDRLLQAGVMP